MVRHHLYPVIGLTNNGLELGNRDFPIELDGQGLTVTTHGADPDAGAIHRHGPALQPQYFVGFRLAFPLLPALAMVEFSIDPGQQASRQRRAKAIDRKIPRAHALNNLPVDVENTGLRTVQFIGDHSMNRAHLLNQLAHIACAGTGGRLVGLGIDPLHQAGIE